jgi:hypothetical protein
MGGDRNGDTWNNDRPDIGNPNAPLDSRATIAPATGPQSCPTTLYRNPDKDQCVNPADVRSHDGQHGFVEERENETLDVHQGRSGK